MIVGSLMGLRGPAIRLVLTGPTGLSEEVVAFIDTGFNSSLILPPTLVAWLGLEWQDTSKIELADGELRPVDLYNTIVVWDGEPRDVSAYAMGVLPLVGMALLRGHRLTIDVIDGGPVTIGPI